MIAAVLNSPFNFAAAGGGGTSYLNTLGSGNRAGLITQTQAFGYTMASPSGLIDGTTGSGGCYLNSVANGDWFQFDFGANKVWDEIKWYQQTSATHGTWKIQGSTDGSTFSDVGSSFTLGGSTLQTITAINGNTTPYRYLRFTKVSGSVTPIYLYEIEIKIEA
jgi:hypothetical protein